jgi:glutamate-1-semialdehyde 2,1-aminomutase
VTRSYSRSKELFQRASQTIPGGVNSPVRAFKSVGGDPPFIVSGKGCRVTDADGNEYIDYVGSWGPLLFGHAADFVVEAVQKAAERGTSFGAPTEFEVEMAELVTTLVPSMEMVRFVSSGSEATAAAIRLARGATNRSKIIKCAGCYHGSVDSLLVSAGSGLATLGIPETAGVTESVAAETIVVEYNDAQQLEDALNRYGKDVAAFIVEPIAGNMGLVLPKEGYLTAARRLTEQHGALLIFDEVITGFRVAPGGAQQLYAITPDLTCLGKIIGGGLPVGAYGGRRDLMQQLAPIGPVYQAGTLSGNPLAMSAGIAVLKRIQQEGPALYERLEEKCSRLGQQMTELFKNRGVAVQPHRIASLFTTFFTEEPVKNYADARKSDTAYFARFFRALLDRGVYIAPSQFECGFISAAHTDKDIDDTVAIAEEALAAL